MKTKRIKGDVMYRLDKDNSIVSKHKGGSAGPRLAVLVLPINDLDALVDQVALAINKDELAYGCGASCDDHARAALRSIGVPLK